MAAIPIYDKKLFKASSPEPRAHWDWIFAQIIGDGRSTKVVKVMIVHWRLPFLRQGQVYFLMHLYGKMLWISNNFSSEASGPMLLKFHVEPPLDRGMKAAKMVAVHWPCPYMVKTFKNLLLQDRARLGAEFLQKLSGTGSLPKLLKWWSYIDVWPFYGEVKFVSVCICMGPVHLYGKNVDNFKWLLLKFHMEPLWGRETKDC